MSSEMLLPDHIDARLQVGGAERSFALMLDKTLAAAARAQASGFGFAAKRAGRAVIEGLNGDVYKRARQPPIRVDGGSDMTIAVDAGSQVTGTGLSVLVLVYGVDREFVEQHRFPLSPGAQLRVSLAEDAASIGIALELANRGSIDGLALRFEGAGARLREPVAPVREAVAPTDEASAPLVSIEAALQLLGRIGNRTVDPAMVRPALDRLKSSGRGAVARAARAILDDAGKVSPERLLLAYHGARAFARMNAYASAAKLLGWIEAQPGHAAAFTEEELTELALMGARVALRTGRADESAERYHRAFLADPDSQEAVLGYALAITRQAPALAASLLEANIPTAAAASPSDLVTMADVLLQLDRPQAAASAILTGLRMKPPSQESFVGLANLSAVLGDAIGWLEALKRYGRSSGLTITGRRADETLTPFAFTTDHRAGGIAGTPLVSVVMTCFNAETTVERAIRSVLAQTVANVEVIVVDDVSTDGSRDVLARIAAEEPRVTILANDANMGTYCAKNRGFQAAKGAFVTFHDSDDWMHPTRIERHLEDHPADAACSTSRWIRMDEGGRILVQRAGTYTHINPASTFVRREPFVELAGFDTVRTGADAEFLARIRARYGERAVKPLDDCLGIGLHHLESLTQSGAAAFDEHRYSPVRLAYTEAWVAWHLEQQEKRGRYGLRESGRRAFEAPEAIAVEFG